ncbi:aldehyde dehydrogenase family protein [Solwaraspora sp. WMMD1047]|uniref:aldehyde dehydrogenase family protein n=1 Tax=Solwaraspora sp. WMMD1047 TaxID=3016102 RepID=UPI00241660F6|nr:aldehyde dehydrogenase family protein [Solwaraspora sp. WMMD1047]MDG4834336.1 aldehyde dehydrogenase family protein [Solwaraspora sp. WMMD1047]
MADVFVGGRAVPTGGGEPIEVRNPANGRIVDAVPDGGADLVDRAVAAAGAAFAAWRRVPGARRGDLLYEAANAVEAQIPELAPLLTAEHGKPLHESTMELARFVKSLKHYAGLGRNLPGRSVADLDEESTGIVLTRPLGVVGILVRWNYPVTLLGKKLGPALVTGNTVVAKPDESTPLTTLRIAQLMHAAGLPDGVFNVVTGFGESTGAALVDHPDVAKIAFTGSNPNGERVMAAAAGRLARVTAELGGSDPLIVDADADIAAAVSAASWGRFFNCGQACLAVKRVYAHESVYDEVVARLVEKTRKLVVGPGDRPGVTVGPMHGERVRARLLDQLAGTLAGGARVVAGGEVPTGEPFDAGWFMQPTIVVDAGHDAPVATEDTFGPVLPVWPVADLDEAIALANASRYGIASSVWTRDLNAALHAARSLHSGYVWVNSRTRVYDELPFGGVKQSGYGKDHGPEALDFYQDVTSVVLSPG